ncbi:hypothetical protein HPP92_004685 [Vanilla planifolia]|uniref:Uncharacterized protein n=1 Tax=Vanilla planifolia TaxID=51239 RepID=A0A835VEP4_VANPL|nr:hypothetical protein HPP92_004685 [Vanilla planifolia]
MQSATAAYNCLAIVRRQTEMRRHSGLLLILPLCRLSGCTLRAACASEACELMPLDAERSLLLLLFCVFSSLVVFDKALVCRPDAVKSLCSVTY